MTILQLVLLEYAIAILLLLWGNVIRMRGDFDDIMADSEKLISEAEMNWARQVVASRKAQIIEARNPQKTVKQLNNELMMGFCEQNT